MTVEIPQAMAEKAEAEAMFGYESSVSAPVRAELGIATLRLGGGVLLSVRNDPTRFWSRALGLGFDEPITRELIDEVCAFYRAEETPRAILQLAPSVIPEDWPDICAATGITGASAWVKLALDLKADTGPDEPSRPLDPALRIELATPDDADEWGATMAGAFGMPPGPLAGMLAGHIGRPGWQTFAAREGSEMVGTGAMYVYEDAAELAGAATLPTARGRGVQTAMLGTRIAAARAAGCRWVVGETGAAAPGTHNSSLHNMRRAGLEVLYERRNWVWQQAS